MNNKSQFILNNMQQYQSPWILIFIPIVIEQTLLSQYFNNSLIKKTAPSLL